MADTNPPKGAEHQQSKDTVSIWLNYLRFFAAEDVSNVMKIEFNSDTALNWLCYELPSPKLDSIKKRYASLGNVDYGLALFPGHQLLVEKVLIPLHQAKSAFVQGHELGCIALCGIVCEMLVLLRFRVSRFGSGEKRMSKGVQRRFFGRTIEDIEHSRRIGIIELLGLIDEQTGDEFREIGKLRNRYLHRLSQNHDETESDARRAYELASKLAVNILGTTVENGKVKVKPEILLFMESEEDGVVED